MGRQDVPTIKGRGKFPFPSNGNAERKNSEEGIFDIVVTVSIPFKRERRAQVRDDAFQAAANAHGFHSLHTGTQSASEAGFAVSCGYRSFPFPSYGNADTKNSIFSIFIASSFRFHSLHTGNSFIIG